MPEAALAAGGATPASTPIRPPSATDDVGGHRRSAGRPWAMVRSARRPRAAPSGACNPTPPGSGRSVSSSSTRTSGSARAWRGCCASASSCASSAAPGEAGPALELVARHQPDVVVVDPRLPEPDAASTSSSGFARSAPGVRILVMSGTDPSDQADLVGRRRRVHPQDLPAQRPGRRRHRGRRAARRAETQEAGPLLDSTRLPRTSQPIPGASAPGADVTDQPKIRVLIVDDHSVVRMGLRMFFDLQPDIEVVGEATDGSEGVAMARRLEPDVVLMDLLMPNMDGITAIGRIKAERPGHRDRDDDLVHRGGAGHRGPRGRRVGLRPQGRRGRRGRRGRPGRVQRRGPSRPGGRAAARPADAQPQVARRRRWSSR